MGGIVYHILYLSYVGGFGEYLAGIERLSVYLVVWERLGKYMSVSLSLSLSITHTLEEVSECVARC